MKVTYVTTDAELEKCIFIRREVFIDEQGVSEEEEIDDEDVIGVGHHVLVFGTPDNDEPAATARYKKYDDTTAKIQRVAVRSKFRKQGYGKIVMEAIEELARRDGYTMSVLDAQCHAENFYKRLGYETVSPETFLDAGILHVRMKKHLL